MGIAPAMPVVLLTGVSKLPKGAVTLPGFRTLTLTCTFCGEFDMPLDVTATVACRLLGVVNPLL